MSDFIECSRHRELTNWQDSPNRSLVLFLLLLSAFACYIFPSVHFRWIPLSLCLASRDVSRIRNEVAAFTAAASCSPSVRNCSIAARDEYTEETRRVRNPTLRISRWPDRVVEAGRAQSGDLYLWNLFAAPRLCRVSRKSLLHAEWYRTISQQSRTCESFKWNVLNTEFAEKCTTSNPLLVSNPSLCANIDLMSSWYMLVCFLSDWGGVHHQLYFWLKITHLGNLPLIGYQLITVTTFKIVLNVSCVSIKTKTS